MSDKSAIEWTDATWNPVTGCSKVSPGCANCYAETLSLRFGHSKLPWTPANAAENVVLHPERLGLPLSWRTPKMVFVNSMSDLFHELVPDEYIVQVFDVMRRCTYNGGANLGRIRDAEREGHTFQVLTKRPDRMASFIRRLRFDPAAERPLAMDSGPIPWRNPDVWLGTSIENDRWTIRADDLRATPSVVRFLSCEPLLGPLPSLDLTGIDWVIVGGESGVGHRPIDPDWVRDLRDRSVAAGVAFFFKQWGGRTPKSGGRELDGRTWDEMPGLANR
jgi:protein gp37